MEKSSLVTGLFLNMLEVQKEEVVVYPSEKCEVEVVVEIMGEVLPHNESKEPVISMVLLCELDTNFV